MALALLAVEHNIDELNLKIERYEGPLDLLLALIEKNKINIFDIPIAEIASQYTEYLENMQKLDLEVTSEFIYYAAELMLIKSRMLLPREEEEEDPRQGLVDALIEYKKAQLRARELYERGLMYYDRFTKEPDEGDGIYDRPHAAKLLALALARVKDRKNDEPEEDNTELFKKIKTERYWTVEEKAAEVNIKLHKRGKTRFLNLFDECKSRSEVIAVFLAVLELISLGRIDAQGSDEEMTVELNTQPQVGENISFEGIFDREDDESINQSEKESEST